MVYKSLLVIQSYEVESLLKEYISFNDKRLEVVGTFKSLFRKIDFEKLYEESHAIKNRFDEKQLELRKIGKNYYERFSIKEKEFFEVLNQYFEALYQAMDQLNTIVFRLYQKSKGSIGKRLSWFEYLGLERDYNKKSKAYSKIGQRLNGVFDELNRNE